MSDYLKPCGCDEDEWCDKCRPIIKQVNSGQLAALVKEMRDAQKQYFRTRDYAVIQQAKELERRVDELVEQIVQQQPRLF